MITEYYRIADVALSEKRLRLIRLGMHYNYVHMKQGIVD